MNQSKVTIIEGAYIWCLPLVKLGSKEGKSVSVTRNDVQKKLYIHNCSLMQHENGYSHPLLLELVNVWLLLLEKLHSREKRMNPSLASLMMK